MRCLACSARALQLFVGDAATSWRLSQAQASKPLIHHNRRSLAPRRLSSGSSVANVVERADVTTSFTQQPTENTHSTPEAALDGVTPRKKKRRWTAEEKAVRNELRALKKSGAEESISHSASTDGDGTIAKGAAGQRTRVSDDAPASIKISKVAGGTGKRKNRETWQVQKEALRKKFGGEAWAPRKRLSPDALEGIRALHTHSPEQFSTAMLADQFEVSPEAIRRILKTKWRPSPSEEEDRLRRWTNRHERIKDTMEMLGRPSSRKKEKKRSNIGRLGINYSDVEEARDLQA